MELPALDYCPTMPEAIRRATRLYGDRDYVVMPDRRMTFAEADRASRRVASDLLERGVGKGARIGMHLTYGTDWIVAFFAITRIGAVALPMSTAYRPVELARSVRHGDVDTLIVAETLFDGDHLDFVAEAFPGAASGPPGPHRLTEAPHLRTILVSGESGRSWAGSIDLSIEGRGGEPAVDEAFLEAVEAEVTPGDWLMIVHTSGTTGEPKGVIHTHGAFVRHNENLSRFNGLDRNHVQFAGLPWFWIGGVVLSVGHALARGFKLVCLERFSNEAAFDLVMAERPDVIGMWGQLGQRFRQYVESRGVDTADIPAYADAPADLTLRHLSLGQTESMGPHTAPGPERDRDLPERLRGSFGPPVPHLQHRIVDPETGADLAEGVEGEVVVRGYSLSAGLYKHERHEAFDDDGWLHTGDRGSFREGFLFFTGRLNEMIKTMGANVAPREVELVLESVDEVGLAVVIGVPDVERGEIVAAVLVPVPGAELDLGAIREVAADQLSSYKVPRRFLVMASDELPQLGSGKPDKRALMTLFVD